MRVVNFNVLPLVYVDNCRRFETFAFDVVCHLGFKAWTASWPTYFAFRRNATMARLKAEEVHLELTFPYFIDKRAPVSGQPGKLDIDVSFEMASNGTDDFILGIKVPATSLCPCSKEISAYGAHNQTAIVP